MFRNIAGILAGALTLGLATPALAQAPAAAPAAAPAPAHTATACPAEKPSLPSELAGWVARSPLAAGNRPSGLKHARMDIGKGIDATLIATPDVKFAIRPEKPGGSVSYAGLYAFTVDQAGTYRVALGSGAWLDVVKAGSDAGAVSIAHGHGPDCSGIRKMVDFALEPGAYILQISANAAQTLPLLVARLP